MKSHVDIELQQATGDQVPERVTEMLTNLLLVVRSPDSDFETAMNAVVLLTVYMANTVKMKDSNFEAWLHAMRSNRKTMPKLRDDALAETPCGFESEPS